MDKKVTAKFWQIYPAAVEGIPFEESLKVIFELKGTVVGEVDGARYQLETKDREKDEPFIGDIIRLQTEAFPTLISKGQKAAKLSLKDGDSLGHHSAFIFDPKTRLLGMEIRLAAAGLLKLTSLVALVAKHPECQALPVLNNSDLNRIAGAKNGTLKIKIADPHSLQAIDPDLATTRDNMIALTELVNGAYIAISIGVGSRREGLETGRVNKIVNWLLGEREAKRGKVRKLQIRQPQENEGLIDFIHARFKETDTLELTGDPQHDWPLREAFLKKALMKAKGHVNL